MKAADLTPGQRHHLLLAVAGRRDYFSKLKARMTAVNWDEHDPAFQAVTDAHEAAHRLVVAVFDAGPKAAPEAPHVFMGDKRAGTAP